MFVFMCVCVSFKSVNGIKLQFQLAMEWHVSICCDRINHYSSSHRNDKNLTETSACLNHSKWNVNANRCPLVSLEISKQNRIHFMHHPFQWSIKTDLWSINVCEPKKGALIC